MKKTFCFISIVLIGICATYFYTNYNLDRNLLVKIQPPENWYLWEGVSAGMNMNMNEDVSVAGISDQQDYLLKWSPENAIITAYTNTSVDLNTRDLSDLIEYTNQRLENPLVHDVIVITKTDKAVEFTTPEQDTDAVTIRHTDINDKLSNYKRIKVFDTHDVASLSVPIDLNNSILMIRNVDKNITDAEVLNLFSKFIIK